jgi:hypothetical protein
MSADSRHKAPQRNAVGPVEGFLTSRLPRSTTFTRELQTCLYPFSPLYRYVPQVIAKFAHAASDVSLRHNSCFCSTSVPISNKCQTFIEINTNSDHNAIQVYGGECRPSATHSLEQTVGARRREVTLASWPIFPVGRYLAD